MALFNKLFSSRKRNYNKNQDNVCEKLFQFTNDQVRVVLFRECDFRGRKLLFDSQAIQKIQLANQVSRPEETIDLSRVEKEKKTYMEISNGYGYLYVKPNSDISQLSEMIFGSVAMSYRGTSYKIHSLTSPPRFMCTQVFPCPRQTTRSARSSAPARTCSHHQNHYNGISSLSLEHSFKLEDSSISCTTCTTSYSDQSVHSTASDTLLVCRRNRSVPLDVPQQSGSNPSSNIPNCSTTGDSGFGGEQSFGSFSSSVGPQSFPYCDINTTNGNGNIPFSCGSIYKRWLRSASTSLEYSTSSLTGSASADECYIKPYPRTRKLGLAIIIQLTYGQEELIQKFLLEHAALIETMMWRVRLGSENAFLRHVNFLSLMWEVAANTTKWLMAFLTGPHVSVHMWQCLSSFYLSCDNFTSITAIKIPNTSKDESLTNNNVNQQYLNRSSSQERLNFSISCSSLTSSIETSALVDSVNCAEKTEFVTFLNLSRFFRNDCYSSKRNECGSSSSVLNCVNNNRSFLAEKFIKELCELLETVDVKHTNFFMSTLITAVLTHHLGWVTTILDPKISDEKVIQKVQKTSNPLWGQLNDLYGAVGCPTKMAHTVITGSNKSELITKMLSTLTYFIRCNDVLRKSISRWDIDEENSIIDRICKEKHCIPKENYKKYQDHLDEMAEINNSNSKKSDLSKPANLDLKLDNTKMNNIIRYSELRKLDDIDNSVNKSLENEEIISNNSIKHFRGLIKTTTCLNDLSKMVYTEQENDWSKKSISNKDNLHEINSFPSINNEFTEVELETKDKEHFGLTNEDITRKVQTLFRGLKDVSKYHSNQEITQKCGRIYLEKQRSSSSSGLLGDDKNKNVVFVLGENEELIGIKSKNKLCNNIINKTELAASENQQRLEKSQQNSNNDIPNEKKIFFTDSFESSTEESSCEFNHSDFKDSDFIKYTDSFALKPSASWTHLKEDKTKETYGVNNDVDPCSTSSFSDQCNKKKLFFKAHSEPPEHVKATSNVNSSSTSKPRFRYTGVKFNFQQHPQIFTNYMKSKNIELSSFSFAEKALKFNSEGLSTNFDFPSCEDNFVEVETLQTPSNASELEFTSELGELESADVQNAKQSTEKAHKTCFRRNFLPNTIIKEPGAVKEFSNEPDQNSSKKQTENLSFLPEKIEMEVKTLKFIELPMPKSIVSACPLTFGYTSSLFRGISECYTSDMVLQGISVPKIIWESTLRKDLTLAARHPLLDQPIEEAVAIVADTDTWEVQLVSSHTYVIDKSASGVRIGMSQLVANMLESLLHMWKLHTPPEYCLMHIEQRLQEFCTKSQALAQMLIATDFCSMELLTTSLQLEINDIPLLMAVASTHSPQITQKYGLSFQ